MVLDIRPKINEKHQMKEVLLLIFPNTKSEKNVV